MQLSVGEALYWLVQLVSCLVILDIPEWHLYGQNLRKRKITE